jgi:SAM-dependent methyltransferase
MQTEQTTEQPAGNSGPLRPKDSWYSRLFARFMAGDYDDDATAARKRRLLADLRGDLLEIGPGSGPNLAYLAPDVRWIGIEPNPYMHDHLRATAQAQGRTVDLRLGHAEQLPAATATLDAVISTHVLCSVQDLAGTLAEIRRVLKPGGKFVFIEHVAAAPDTGLRRFQNGVRPLWRLIGDGCYPNRETWRAIENAGFSEVQIEHYRADLAIVSPHIAGYAIN